MIIDLNDERLKRETKKALENIGIKHEDIVQYPDEDYDARLLEILQSSKNKLNIIENVFNDFFINIIEEENSLLFVIFLIERMQNIIKAVEGSGEDSVNQKGTKAILDYLGSLKVRVFNAHIVTQVGQGK